MLVFISDLHLTDLDDDKDRDVKLEAFNEFFNYLNSRSKKSGAEKINVVLLGDIFDVIRSNHWFNEFNTNDKPIRPWSNNEDKDKKSQDLESYTKTIVDKICEKNENLFNDLKNKKGISFTYIIGNHDWLIYRYPSVKQKIEQFFHPNKIAFKLEFSDKKHNVFAHHGHRYDPFNSRASEKGNGPSIGDAIVIGLLNEFLSTLKNNGISEKVIERLKEIHNVGRPIDIPFWISWVCENEGSDGDKKNVKKAWNEVVKKFLKIDFVKNCNSWCERALKQVLKGSRLSPLPFTEFRLNLKGEDYKFDLRLPLPCEVNYSKNASKEGDGAEFILYGHTHNSNIEFLGQKNRNNRIYINTGSWRKVYTKSVYDRKKFIGWHDMVAVVLYTKEESKKSNKGRYEIWHMLHG